jgi:hypothetical protein
MIAIAPYFGYLASLLLILALIVNNDLKFRWYNLFGNIAFIIYGIVLMAIPVLITNGILLVINVFYLYKAYNRHEYFDLIEFTGEEKLATKFLTYHQKDIASYFPAFQPIQLKNHLNFVVLRDLVIANMFSADVDAQGDAVVCLNYTLLKYRDFKVGRFIFDKERNFLRGKGVKRIVYKNVAHPKHAQFLKVMGFSPLTVGAENWMVKEL